MRKIILVALASSTLGGAIAALATAAAQSAANPAAIAAAVQNVEDRSAERTLSSVHGDLVKLESAIGSLSSSLAAGPYGSTQLSAFLRQIETNVYVTCRNVQAQTSPPASFCQYP